MARKATRSISLSPVVRSVNRKLDVARFIEVWKRCSAKGLGVKDVAYMLNWHLDDVVSVARQAREMLSLVGEDLPSLQRYA